MNGERSRRFSLVTLSTAALIALLTWLGLTGPVDRLFLNAWFRLRGPQPTTGDILIVPLDERFIAEYPQRIGELDRGFHARVITQLTEAGARVIGLDMFFPEESARVDGGVSADARLASAILSGPVVLPHVVWYPGVLPGQAAPEHVGAFSIRDHLPYHPLLTEVPRGALVLEEAANYVSPKIRLKDGALLSFSARMLERAGLTPKRKGRQLIDYRGPAGSFPSISYLDVYRGRFSFGEVQDKIVLMGVSLIGTDRDQVLTPFGEMPGVEVNANQVYTLLYGGLVSLPAGWYALILTLVGSLWSFWGHRRRTLLFTSLACIVAVVLSLGLFRLGLFVSPFPLLLVLVFGFVFLSYEHLRKLDSELYERLSYLLRSASLEVLPNQAPNTLVSGFTPLTSSSEGDDVIASLVTALSGRAGLLFLNGKRYSFGAVNPALHQLATRAEQQKQAQQSGTMPYYYAEPILRETVRAQEPKVIGSIALDLPAPLPHHLRVLIGESAETFKQLSYHHYLRQQTQTLSTTIWPWGRQSSLDKIGALSALSDLMATERSWLGALLETLTQAVFITSPYGYSIYKNAAARRLFGKERNMLRAIPEVLKIAPQDFHGDYLSTVERGEWLELGLSERNSKRPVLLSLRVVRVGGQVKGMAGVVSDLSKVEEMQRERQELIAMVAHDLRTPLTSIRGFAELLLDSAEGEAQEYLGIINDEADRMKRLTDEFLELSRLESGEVTLELSPVNLGELLRHAVATVSVQATHKSIPIAVEAPAHLMLDADQDLIMRIIINLLSNAVKYSPEGSRITARLSATKTDVKLEIEDHGYGMTEAQQQGLFQRYKRIKDGPQTAVSGTGLGLYVVKLICAAHGGEVSVRSSPGEGSTFIVHLPVRQAQAVDVGDEGQKAAQ